MNNKFAHKLSAMKTPNLHRTEPDSIAHNLFIHILYTLYALWRTYLAMWIWNIVFNRRRWRVASAIQCIDIILYILCTDSLKIIRMAYMRFARQRCDLNCVSWLQYTSLWGLNLRSIFQTACVCECESHTACAVTSISGSGIKCVCVCVEFTIITHRFWSDR